MFGAGRTCSLCGGKLQGNICTECGLDNSKNDSNYETAQSHSEWESLTHVHETAEPFAGKTLTDEQRDEMKAMYVKAKPKKQKPQTSQKPQKKQGAYASAPGSLGRTGTKKAGKKRSGIWLVVVLVLMGGSIFSGLTDSGYEEDWEEDSYVYSEDVYEYDPYEYVQYDLAETGESYSVHLTAGSYKGGVHIPEGSYTVRLVSGEGSLSIEDNNNSIYQSFRFGEWEDMNTEISDFRVYEGSRIEMEEDMELSFETNNARLPLQQIPNPNTMEYAEVSGDSYTGTFTVGTDVQAGVYDVICLEGAGILNYTIAFEDGYTSYEGKLIGAGDSSFPESYKNVVLPEGTEVEIGIMVIKLVPSEMIESTDYLEYYR